MGSNISHSKSDVVPSIESKNDSQDHRAINNVPIETKKKQQQQMVTESNPKTKVKSIFESRKQSIKSLMSISRSKSRNSNNSRLRRQEQLIVEIMMPLYFSEETLLSENVDDAKASWDMIVNDQSQHFNAIKSFLPFHSCREYFEKEFYDRLFDIHPFCKKMFSNPSTQGKFLTALFSFIFTVIDDEAKFNDRLIELAKSHTNMGVKSTEYAIIGEVMFTTTKKCLGAAYTVKVHEAWVKLFSKMLSVIVPVSVSFELLNNKKQKKRVDAFFHGIVTESCRTDMEGGTSKKFGTEGESGCPIIKVPSRQPLYQLPRSFQIGLRWMWTHNNNRVSAYIPPQTNSKSLCPMVFTTTDKDGKGRRRMLPYLVRWMAKDPLDEKADWADQALEEIVMEGDEVLSSKRFGRAKPIDRYQTHRIL